MNNRKIILALVIFCFVVNVFIFLVGVARAGSVTFGWIPNSEPDLAGYTIHYGPESRNYTLENDCGLPETVDGQVVCTMEVPAAANMFFAATAYDEGGGRSDYSNEVEYNPPPDAVQGLIMIEVTVKVTTANQ